MFTIIKSIGFQPKTSRMEIILFVVKMDWKASFLVSLLWMYFSVKWVDLYTDWHQLKKDCVIGKSKKYYKMKVYNNVEKNDVEIKSACLDHIRRRAAPNASVRSRILP